MAMLRQLRIPTSLRHHSLTDTLAAMSARALILFCLPRASTFAGSIACANDPSGCKRCRRTGANRDDQASLGRYGRARRTRTHYRFGGPTLRRNQELGSGGFRWRRVRRWSLHVWPERGSTTHCDTACPHEVPRSGRIVCDKAVRKAGRKTRTHLPEWPLVPRSWCNGDFSPTSRRELGVSTPHF